MRNLQRQLYQNKCVIILRHARYRHDSNRYRLDETISSLISESLSVSILLRIYSTRFTTKAPFDSRWTFHYFSSGLAADFLIQYHFWPSRLSLPITLWLTLIRGLPAIRIGLLTSDLAFEPEEDHPRLIRGGLCHDQTASLDPTLG